MQSIDINQLNYEVQTLSCKMNDIHNILMDLRQEMSQRITYGEFHSKITTLEDTLNTYTDQTAKLTLEVENLLEQETYPHA